MVPDAWEVWTGFLSTGLGLKVEIGPPGQLATRCGCRPVVPQPGGPLLRQPAPYIKQDMSGQGRGAYAVKVAGCPPAVYRMGMDAVVRAAAG